MMIVRNLSIVEVEQHWLQIKLFQFLTCSVITIGFNPSTYTVAESSGSVNVTVNILNGTLARDVHVLLMTALTDGTATGI